jgi:MFS family permease
LGLSKATAGLFVTLITLIAIPGALVGGRLADRWGRKRVYLVSRVLAALALLPCTWLGVSRFVPWLLLANSFLGGAARPAQSAMVADLTTPESRQAAFSLLYLGVNLGFAAGPALAGLLYRQHLAWLFLGDALTTLLAVVLIHFFVAETLPGGSSPELATGSLPAEERPERGSLVSALIRRPHLLAFAALTLAYNLAYSQYGFALPLQVQELFGAEGPAFYGLLMSLAGLVVVIFTAPATRLTVSLSHTSNMALGGVLYALGFGMIALISRREWFYLSTVIWTLGEIAVSTNIGAYIASNSPVSHRGRFSAFFDMVGKAGLALGPLVMGWVMDLWGLRAVWAACFAVLAVSAFLMPRLSRPVA